MVAAGQSIRTEDTVVFYIPRTCAVLGAGGLVRRQLKKPVKHAFLHVSGRVGRRATERESPLMNAYQIGRSPRAPATPGSGHLRPETGSAQPTRAGRLAIKLCSRLACSRRPASQRGLDLAPVPAKRLPMRPNAPFNAPTVATAICIDGKRSGGVAREWGLVS
ncbi:unnamed protein product [Protopolystoma xenopodis]|uniref:Uncharacterized protein n=1 Tax=Protopolystoma xenopodis TaxID=117903 RepID=A0A448XEA9_9PLAT|nr:unnamed protein product [Protopolystoma xenopodis]